MTGDSVFPLEGGCDCGAARYRILTAPMFVHCCHCTWCQRETGTAFALNALIEADRLVLLKGEIDAVNTPSSSGSGQLISRCSICRIALWSNYGGREAIRFLRVGTLDEAFRIKPDIHIYTSTKQPWVILSPDALCVPAYYDSRQVWPAESIARRAAVIPYS